MKEFLIFTPVFYRNRELLWKPPPGGCRRSIGHGERIRCPNNLSSREFPYQSGSLQTLLVLCAGENKTFPLLPTSPAIPDSTSAAHLGTASRVTPQEEFAPASHVSPQLRAKGGTTTAFKIPMATAPSLCKLWSAGSFNTAQSSSIQRQFEACSQVVLFLFNKKITSTNRWPQLEM